MGEPFSIATGAFQVAGAGYQLAKTLYAYGKGVHDAERDISIIAAEVQLTSGVLRSLGEVLQSQDVLQLCSETLQIDAQGALNGCTVAFNRLETALKLASKKNTAGKMKMSFSVKAKWPLNKSRMTALQSNLERLKTTLSLMLDVLNLASTRDLNARSNNQESEDANRLRIERLIKSNEELYQKIANGQSGLNVTESGLMSGSLYASADAGSIESELSSTPTLANPRTELHGANKDHGNSVMDLFQLPNSKTLTSPIPEGARSVGAIDQQKPEDPSVSEAIDTAPALSRPQDTSRARDAELQYNETDARREEFVRITRLLESCRVATSRLHSSLEQAMESWYDSEGYHVSSAIDYFNELTQAFSRIHEQSWKCENCTQYNPLSVDPKTRARCRHCQPGGDGKEPPHAISQTYSGYTGDSTKELVLDDDGRSYSGGRVQRNMSAFQPPSDDLAIPVETRAKVKNFSRPPRLPLPIEDSEPTSGEATLLGAHTPAEQEESSKTSEDAEEDPGEASEETAGQVSEEILYEEPEALGVSANFSPKNTVLQDLGVAKESWQQPREKNPKQGWSFKDWNSPSPTVEEVAQRESKPAGPFATFDGLHTFPGGLVKDCNGDLVGMITEGDVWNSDGLPVDDDGYVIDKHGNIVGLAILTENILDDVEDDGGRKIVVADEGRPFQGLEGLRVTETGLVVDKYQNVVGRVKEPLGDLEYLVGFTVRQDGNIVDGDGDMVGRAVPVSFSRPSTRPASPTAEDQLPGIEALEGKDLNEAGEILDERGGILAEIEVEELRSKIANGEIDPLALGFNDEGQLVDQDGNILTQPSKERKDGVEEARQQAAKLPEGAHVYLDSSDQGSDVREDFADAEEEDAWFEMGDHDNKTNEATSRTPIMVPRNEYGERKKRDWSAEAVETLLKRWTKASVVGQVAA